MDKTRKNLGIGTLSIPIIILGFLFGFSWCGVCLGDSVLRFIGVNSWSNGTSGIHYTAFYSFIFFIAASLLAFKWRNDFGARIGRIASMTVGGVLLISIFTLS